MQEYRQVIEFLRAGKQIDQWLTYSSEFNPEKMLARYQEWLPHMLADGVRLAPPGTPF